MGKNWQIGGKSAREGEEHYRFSALNETPSTCQCQNMSVFDFRRSRNAI